MLPPSLNLEKHLEPLPSDELFALAERIEELQSHPGWVAVSEFIETGRENIRRILERGATREQADYARIMGFLSGTSVAADVAREIMEAASDRRLRLEREAEAAERERAEQAADESVAA